MVAPILVAVRPDSSDGGPVAFAAAVSRFTGAPVVLVAVGGAPGDPYEALTAAPRAAGVPVTVRAVEHDNPAHGVAMVVREVEPALVVVGSTHRGRLGRVLLGSTGHRMTQGSPSPVAVVPHGYEASELRTVGAGFTPGPEGRAALQTGAHLSRASHARLVVVMVLDPKHAEEQSPGLLAGEHHDRDAAEAGASRARHEAEAALRQGIAELAADVEAEPDVLFQDAADGLVAASHRLDLLILGSRASGDAGSVTLGGMTRRVVAQAACPVVVLPRGDARRIDQLLAAAEAEALG